ncbi:MAG: hypothetical protein IPO81_28055 [Kouleothrix sp.]|nr:hypothetical protein [Kouleothrix sp.]
MRSITKLLARLALVPVALVAFAAPALAAAPNNDTFASAKVVALDFSETLDTTQATTGQRRRAGEPNLRRARNRRKRVVRDRRRWGRREDRRVGASTYSAGVIVATGTAGNLTTLTCGPSFAVFKTEAGTPTTCWPSTTRATAAATAGVVDIQIQHAFVPDVDFSGIGTARSTRGAVPPRFRAATPAPPEPSSTSSSMPARRLAGRA